MTTEKLLDTEEVATWWNLPERTVRHMADKQEIPGVKIGKRGMWRFVRGELQAYLDQQRNIPRPPSDEASLA